jgi:hypothetical protein
MIEGLRFDGISAVHQASLVSLVVPVFNEHDAVGHFAAAIDATVAKSWSDGTPAPVLKSSLSMMAAATAQQRSCGPCAKPIRASSWSGCRAILAKRPRSALA